MRVCIIAEGSYPVTRGGLSEWAHMLVKSLKNVRFDIYCITPTAEDKWKPIYQKFPNVDRIIIKPLIRPETVNHNAKVPNRVSSALVKLLKSTTEGQPADFSDIALQKNLSPVSKDWLGSKPYWDFLIDAYHKNYNEGSFSEYFWTIAGLNSILLDSLNFIREIPEADIYHALSAGFAGYAGGMIKATRGGPLVISEQGLYLVERKEELARQNFSPWYQAQIFRFSESLVKTSYKYADKIIPCCYHHLNLEKQMGVDPAKIALINNGIETERFVPAQKRNGHKPLVGCFARVVPIKEITTFIKAAKMVIDKSPADFAVIGDIQDPQYYDECRKLVEKFGISDQFKFVGHVNPIEWYHKTDIFTLSSKSEGVPYALLEAMSCGLPCVCTDVGGMGEILADGLGFVVPPGQPESLAQAIHRLVVDKELRTAMGRRATQVAREKYTLKEEAGHVFDLYKGLRK